MYVVAFRCYSLSKISLNRSSVAPKQRADVGNNNNKKKVIQRFQSKKKNYSNNNRNEEKDAARSLAERGITASLIYAGRGKKDISFSLLLLLLLQRHKVL